MTDRARDFETLEPDDMDCVPPIDKSALSDERKHLFNRVEQINRAWLDSMRQMRRAEAEFSIKLFTCKGADEAMVLCHQWMAKRLEILGAEQQLFAKSWTDLVSLLSHSSHATGPKKHA
jgi:hypothetical protein